MVDDLRQKILDGLRKHRGAQAELVRRTRSIKSGGFSRSYVYQVLAGDRVNLDIINLAADILAERSNRKREQIKSLNQKVAALQHA